MKLRSSNLRQIERNDALMSLINFEADAVSGSRVIQFLVDFSPFLALLLSENLNYFGLWWPRPPEFLIQRSPYPKTHCDDAGPHVCGLGGSYEASRAISVVFQKKWKIARHTS